MPEHMDKPAIPPPFDGWRTTASEGDDFADHPPSYDDATFGPAPALGGSTSSTHPVSGPSPGTRNIPKDIMHLFSSPSNAEPLLGRDEVPTEQITAIESRKRGKWIESWDPKLSDPDVLYDFLRVMAMTPPALKIRCFGAHMETHHRDETVIDPDGTPRIKKKGQTEQVVDFDFTIDLSSIINHPENSTHIHLSALAPFSPNLRGTHKPTYAATYASPSIDQATLRHHQRRGYTNLPSGDGGDDNDSAVDVGRRATRKEVNIALEYDAYRLSKGLPRWVKMEDCPEFWESRGKGKATGTSHGERGIELAEGVMEDLERDAGAQVNVRSNHGDASNVGPPVLRDWCRAYCADPGLLKELYLTKQLWGWELEGVLSAIKGAILSTGYQSNYLNVTIDIDPIGVIVRPNNTLSRALGNTFIYFLSWITMIYPLIWIWKRLHPMGGSPWNVGRVSYAMKYYPALPSTYANETIESAKSRLPALFKTHPEIPRSPQPILQYGPKGVHYLVGRKEGEWFREWEERIRMGARMRFKGVLEGGRAGEREDVDLDGY